MIIFIILLTNILHLSNTGSLPPVQQAKQALVDSLLANYKKNIQPDAQVEVEMNANIQQIVSIDEKQQIMTSSLFILQIWADQRLSWTPNASNLNTTTIMVPVKSLWIPDTMIVNSADANPYLPVSDYSYASVYYNGTIDMILPALSVRTRCPTNTRKFPFDKQMCSINLTSWSHGLNRITYIEDKDTVIDTSEYMEHMLWQLERTDMVVLTAEDRASFEDADSHVISIQLFLTRKPLFFMMNGIFACLILNSVTLISYLLPFATQISLSMICFMTYSVYSLNFSNLFPQQSEYLMMITLYFLLSIGWTLLSMAWFVLCNHYTNKSELPKYLDDFCQLLKNGSSWFCRKKTNQVQVQTIKETTMVEDIAPCHADPAKTERNEEKMQKKCNFCNRCDLCQAEVDKNEMKGKNKKVIESKCKVLNYFVLFWVALLMLISNLVIWIIMSN